MKVLIVDADWRFAAQATKFLEDRAHLVVHQTKPSAAHLAHWKPDLVILSAALADDATIELIRSTSPHPAVLLTESMARFDRAWRVWQQIGDELLMKPVFSSQDFQNAMVAAMENAAAGTGRRQLAVSA